MVEKDLEYLQRAYPDEMSVICPALPPYGGLLALDFTTCLAGDSLEGSPPGSSRDVDKASLYRPIDEAVADPVVLWWTPHTGWRDGQRRKCPAGVCFFTENRSYYNFSKTEAFIFYGTDFRLEDLPLPRMALHQWALAHEESPKNNAMFSYGKLMRLFNHTSTFKRQSHHPITTQFLSSLDQLTSVEYMTELSTKSALLRSGQRALLMYAHSDCEVPSDRDNIVKMLQNHVSVDSYGTCVHNKDLPDHLSNPVNGMDHKDFFRLVGTYKFSLAMENALCDDYITEKFWRPLIAGSVPVVLGSSKIKDFAPSNKSIIDIMDFNSIADLVSYLRYLDSNDTAYSEYLSFKGSQGITNDYLKRVMTDRPWDATWGIERHLLHLRRKPNYVETFECSVCDAIHNNRRLASSGKQPKVYAASKEHYGCPFPTSFVDSRNLTRKILAPNFWSSVWTAAYYNVLAFLKLSDGGRSAFDVSELHPTSIKMHNVGISASERD